MPAQSEQAESDGAATQPRRAEILELAASLFAEQGVDKTTMRDIGKAAGILSGSLYHHFESKEAIVTEVIGGYLRRRVVTCNEIEAAHPDPRKRLAALLRSEINDIAGDFAARVVNSQSRYVLGLLPEHKDIRDHASEVRAIWLRTIHDGVAQGVFRSDVDVEIFYALARKTTSVAQQWVNGLSDTPKPVADAWGADLLADTWISILLDGMAEKPRRRVASGPAPRTRTARR